MSRVQEVKIIICSGAEIGSEQPIANIFLSESEPEESVDALFGRFRRRMAKKIQHKQGEWPVMLRIAGPSSMQELWCSRVTNIETRFAMTDVLIFVLSTKTRADFTRLCGLHVAEDNLVLDHAASPQLQRVLVATYSDASQDSWAVKEGQLNSLASLLRCELRIISEEDVEGAMRVLDEAAGEVVLWRARNGKLHEEDAQAHNKQAEDGQKKKKVGRWLALCRFGDKLFKRSPPG